MERQPGLLARPEAGRPARPRVPTVPRLSLGSAWAASPPASRIPQAIQQVKPVS